MLRRGPAPLNFSRYSSGPANYRTYRSGGAWGWLPGLLGSAALAAVLQQLEREASGRPQQSRRQQPQPQQDGDSIKKPMQTADLPTGMDSIETDEAVWYFVDLPGLDKKEIQVTANQQARSITISGERFQPTVGEEGTKATTNLRRQLGKFSYTVDLPKDADPQLISAKVDKGILRIKVLKTVEPEAEPEVQTVQIE